MRIVNQKQDFLYTTKQYQQLREKFVSDRVTYRDLRGRWCNNILLDVYVPSEEKSDDSKDSPYEELEQVFHNFRTYNMKILLGDLLKKL